MKRTKKIKSSLSNLEKLWEKRNRGSQNEEEREEQIPPKEEKVIQMKGKAPK